MPVFVCLPLRHGRMTRSLVGWNPTVGWEPQMDHRALFGREEGGGDGGGGGGGAGGGGNYRSVNSRRVVWCKVSAAMDGRANCEPVKMIVFVSLIPPI